MGSIPSYFKGDEVPDMEGRVLLGSLNKVFRAISQKHVPERKVTSG